MAETGAESFDAYVAARQHALLRTAYLLTGDRHEAEDLVQTALTKTYLAWSRVRDPDAYVRRAMVNVHISWWRRAWRREERPTDAVPEPTATPEPDLADRDEVWALVRSLPPRQRAVVVLRFYEDLTPAEVADILGCTAGTVASQTNRAIAALRARYDHQGGVH
ncbi:SigE family RNA polymerase sigma factor [Tenggerimyces flavus]|uniref:SigE family RNA polymerase sigma factor n=1 Tax=Tenggerimyces flavus TaxID=1708749 RepID=A0ABV7YB13_9ACTN|nr:SigE family RNA polymerase sigma factor [Tenggerimyces flavus]MBM7788945.1 RNA polymerase sigma-70 factor (sigma-E family) [Tenggerimyces flavus]